MSKISIVLSKKTHDESQALGRKGQTFDQLVSTLLERQQQQHKPDKGKLNGERGQKIE